MATHAAIQTNMRAAAVALLTEYAASVNLKCQIYRARPLSVTPPTFFVEAMSEVAVDFTTNRRQRTPSILIRAAWGDFDSGTAVDQRDAFVDGFTNWVTDRWHAAGANALVAAVRITDDPVWYPDWIRPAGDAIPKSYYSSLITLEGYAAD